MILLLQWAVGLLQQRRRLFVRKTKCGIAEFVGLEIAGLENDGRSRRVEIDGLNNDGLEFRELRNEGLKIFQFCKMSVTRY